MEKLGSDGPIGSRARIAAMGEALGSVEQIWRDPPTEEEAVAAVCRVTDGEPSALHGDAWEGCEVTPDDNRRLAVCILLLEDSNLPPERIVRMFSREQRSGMPLNEHIWHYYNHPKGSSGKVRPIVEAARAELGSTPRRIFHQHKGWGMVRRPGYDAWCDDRHPPL